MARFAWFCYGSPSKLVLRNSGDVILSSLGSQQGCPLGPLLFCLAMHPLIASINRDVPLLALNRWYLDDGGLVGRTEHVQAAFDIIRRDGPARGLQVNLMKCQLVWFSSDVRFRLDPFPENIQRYPSSDFDMLGSPIGSKEFCSSFVEVNSLAKCRGILSKLPGLNDPQSAFLLLRFCLSFCKLVHLMRTAPCGDLDVALKEFDQMIMESFQSLFPYPVDSTQIAQAKLNIGYGGLGLRGTYEHHCAAFLASISLAIPGIDFSDWSFAYSISKEAFDSAKVLMPVSKPANVSLDDPASVPPQKVLSSYINASLQKELYEVLDNVGKARLNSISARYASSWLSALPLSFLGQKFSPQEWGVSIAYRLGVNMVLDGAPCPMDVASCWGWMLIMP
jgi:hypothetical protein